MLARCLGRFEWMPLTITRGQRISVSRCLKRLSPLNVAALTRSRAPVFQWSRALPYKYGDDEQGCPRVGQRDGTRARLD